MILYILTNKNRGIAAAAAAIRMEDADGTLGMGSNIFLLCTYIGLRRRRRSNTSDSARAAGIRVKIL